MRLMMPKSNPEGFVVDLAHSAIFGRQSIARAVNPDPAVTSRLQYDRFWAYRQSLLRPRFMNVVGLGVSHAQLLDLSNKHFGSGWSDLQLTGSAPATEPLVYRPNHLIEANADEPNLLMYLAWPGADIFIRHFHPTHPNA